MKVNSQFDVYAAFYNLLYKDKNYRGEAEYIHQLIKKFLPWENSNTSLLDLACGTGKHLLELASKGYNFLAGSDISQSMIDIAIKNTEAEGKKISYYNHSFQESNKIDKTFDVVLSMFSAINYITSFNDQSKTFSNIHSLLRTDGLFIFDYWNGTAVTESYSPVKVLRKKHEDVEIIRISETSLDPIEQLATVKFTCIFLKDDKKVAEFEETHSLHYYYFSEMKNLLQSHGFKILHIAPFMDMDKGVSTQDWNISVIARKLD